MSFSYFAMLGTVLIGVFLALRIRHNRRWALVVGCLSWFLTIFYFLIEFFVIKESMVPYSFLDQPMSDLGVTVCGTNTYLLAPYEICSPAHLLMNWTFTITGLTTVIGAICLQQFWPATRMARVATWLLIIFGLSMSVAGIIPADVSFVWHTLASLPGMFVQIPALFLLGKAIRGIRPKLATWSYICGALTSAVLLSLFLQAFISLPGGLLQRLLYASVYVWSMGTAVVIWRNRGHLLSKEI